jgi:hypothetical protein
VDEDGYERDENAEMNHPPFVVGPSPPTPRSRKGDAHDGSESHQAEDAGLGPEVQHDVVGIGEAVGMVCVPVGRDRRREA